VRWRDDRWQVVDVHGYPTKTVDLRKTIVIDPARRYLDEAESRRDVPVEYLEAHEPLKINPKSRKPAKRAKRRNPMDVDKKVAALRRRVRALAREHVAVGTMAVQGRWPKREAVYRIQEEARREGATFTYDDAKALHAEIAAAQEAAVAYRRAHLNAELEKAQREAVIEKRRRDIW